VFQHIPVRRGVALFERLLAHVADGGAIALHVLYARPRPRWRNVVAWARHHVPFVHPLANLIEGRRMGEPPMQMNVYDVNALLDSCRRSGIRPLHLEFTDHAGSLGVMIHGRRSSVPQAS
jgi:hypothetical protein